MGKNYEPPMVEFLELDPGEIVTASGSIPSGKPGWGWGDKNHDHSGPPGLMRQDAIPQVSGAN